MYFSAMYIDYVDIARLGGAKQGWSHWSVKASYFEDKCVNISKTIGVYIQNYY